VQERFAQEKGEYTLPIEEGVVEQQENKIIVLAQ
jgi:ATP synthase, delta/epsilon subunit, beta-sandwich domain protein